MAVCYQCKTREAVAGKKSCQECLDVKKRQSKERAEKLRDQGMCRCGKNPIVPGTTCCEPCRVRRIKYVQDRKKKNIDKGLCPCGRDKPAEGKKLCEKCGAISRERSLRHYKKHVESGLCIQCGKEEKWNGRSRCQKCTERHRENQHLHNYGIGKGGVKKLLSQQGNKCKICGADLSGGYHVDHDHETNEVRGILCPGCNTFLGKFEKRYEYLNKIQNYIDKPPDV